MTAPTADAGSFRDPMSRVFLSEDRVLRALSADAAADLRAAMDSRFFAKEVAAHRLIETTLLEGAPDELGVTGEWEALVEHPRLPLWSYPYEWTFSMLQDAALLQLDLQGEALAENLACKDATAFNVQFDGSSPIFVDVGSFERYRDGDPWYGYLQFCQLFLFPLLFQAYADLPFQSFLRADINGITPDVANRVLGPLRIWRKGMLVHVALHARMQRSFADSDDDVKSSLKESGFKKELIEANVKNLHKLIASLQWKQSESTWSDYSDRAHYTDKDLAQKAEFVKETAGRKHRRLVWDIGCNDGHFSRLVAGDADHVVAFDGDHLVVDVLYRSLRQDGPGNIIPLVQDISQPSPGLGWRGRERAPFLERFQPDLVLALAVIHHIAITANVPTAEFLDLLVDLGTSVVLEFPTEDDPMVKRLLRNKREGVHDDYNLATITKQIEDRFAVERQVTLPSGTRVLFELNPR